jgi:hypothetical protein
MLLPEEKVRKAKYFAISSDRATATNRVVTVQFQSFLEQVAARFATQADQAFWLRGLFWSIGSIDATTLGVIDELVHRGDNDSVRDALQLLGGTPPELALSRPHFAVHIIEESGHADP